jgi:Fic family protein
MSRRPAKKAAKIPGKFPPKAGVRDDGEDVYLMEPMRISQENNARPALTELVLEITKQNASFRSSLPLGLTEPLADFVRSMNCYYSNLIEGHNTHPVDIERALNDDYSPNPEKRDLQLEAKAHIEVQRWIDDGGLSGREASTKGVLEVHRRFTNLLPEKLRWVMNPVTGEAIPVEPGATRTRDVKVGSHIAPSPGAIPRFMRRFEENFSGLSDFEAILEVAPAHHRLLFIHPFADGNGRVTRLMSYATLLRALETGGLWSIARGLARRQDDYKSHLAACDKTRRGDRDGRGQLSEAALSDFTKFFLETCIDQIKFMRGLMQPTLLRSRLLKWAEEETAYGHLPPKASRVLEAILFTGALPKSEVAGVLDQSVRSARAATNALSRQAIITADGVRGDWRLAFPAKLAPRLMPGLFPDQLALPDPQ